MRSKLKDKWLATMAEELRALEDNGVWRVRLVACDNEQEFGVDYSVTFSAVIEMSSVKRIFVLARKWRVPATHGDVPNAFVKAEKEAELDIFLRLPRGMVIPKDVRRRLGVTNNSELMLELMKTLHRKAVLVVIGVYVDDLLVTRVQQHAVDTFFGGLTEISIKDLGPASKFLDMRAAYNEDEGYEFDQELAIEEMLREHGIESAHSVRTPIGTEANEINEASDELLPASGGGGVMTMRKFQSLVGDLMWVVRCTRPDIAFAVHKASRRTHSPTMSDWKLGKRVARYLAGTKHLRLKMKGYGGVEEPLMVVAYSDADFAADKADRSVTGGLLTVDGMAVSWVCRNRVM
ncbi:hypothetical protein PR003_g16747 [Phytophthora rubi]|uniref:Reverse transcriptase Ty1/copia-type domain-containing protein n=1 Tax=Phytophthora rubi TaxID=129364 RepID=A0A6A4ELY1_9STRA|nr:hypothetical protein PR003_g16747 [Phytophthora rubi]